VWLTGINASVRGTTLESSEEGSLEPIEFSLNNVYSSKGSYQYPFEATIDLI